jgi:tetratricopeptide (TPR) repeat protein
MMSAQKPIKVFFSYAHVDEGLRDELGKHLSNLKRQGVIESWHDRQITAGAEWADKIDKNLDEAQIILLLISADFMASDYCSDIEVTKAMERHHAGEACVIPVILRPIDWAGAPFSNLQALPTNAEAVTKWSNTDDAFLDITNGIRELIESISGKVISEKEATSWKMTKALNGQKTEATGDRSVSIGGDVSQSVIITGDVQGDFKVDVTTQPDIPEPPEPERLQKISGFIGRETELEAYIQRLETEKFVCISGIAGVGKTWLSIAIISEVASPENVFWHRFKANEGCEVVIEKIAAFLAYNEQSDLWEMIQTARLLGGNPYETEILVDYIIQLIQDRKYWFCFDDFHLVDGNSNTQSLVQRMREATRSTQVYFIITTRSIPAFIDINEYHPLAGLSRNDVHKLVVKRGLELSQSMVSTLHRKTDGNAEIINLAIISLSAASNKGGFIEKLDKAKNVQRYILNEVDRRLNADERAVMRVCSILLGYSANQDIIEAIVNENVDVWGTLFDLADRHLLTTDQTEVDAQAYHQHAILQGYFYNALSKTKRLTYHRKAGEYYETEENNILRAAEQFEKAEVYPKSADLVTRDVWRLINLSEISATKVLLESLRHKSLDQELQARINIDLAEIEGLAGDPETAFEIAENTYEFVSSFPESPTTRMLQARASLSLGAFLQNSRPLEAQTWLQKGLGIIRLGENKDIIATLHFTLGSVQLILGDYDAAQQSVENGLALTGQIPSTHLIDAYTNLGIIYSEKGNFERGSKFTQQALGMCDQFHDHYRKIKLLSNLGLDKFFTGEWDAGIKDSQEAIVLAEQIGSVEEQARIALNLGWMYMNKGIDEKAIINLEKCISLSQKHGRLDEFEISGKATLADLHIRGEKLDVVDTLLREAMEGATQAEMNDLLPEIYRHWAEFWLAKQDFLPAMDYINQSIKHAAEMGLDPEEGSSLRVKGQILATTEKFDEAITNFERSLELVEGDPYETARTQAQLGIILAKSKSKDEKHYLQTAHTTFENLGATRELEYTNNLMTAL